MTTRAKLFLARLLIVFSVILILWGAILQFNETRVLHPKDDVKVLAGVDEDVISVTTADDEDVINPIAGGNNAVPEGGATNNVVSPGVSDSDANSNSNGSASTPTVPVQPNPTPTPTPTPTPAPEPEPTPEVEVTPMVPTIDENNIQLRNTIENKYGITIKYGNETEGYSVGGMSTVVLPDAATSQVALNNLNNALALYPEGFFQEIASNGYPLTIYLIKRYSTPNVTGVTDSSDKQIVISIATDYDFSDTLHHEVYHYVERYIFSKGFRFTSWSTLNPGGFSYGTVDSQFSYTKTYSEDSFFVNNYAQTDEYEDRASTFEYMMKASKASCLNYGKTVWLKAKTMSEQIDYFLNSVSPNVTEYWERHVY